MRLVMGAVLAAAVAAGVAHAQSEPSPALSENPWHVELSMTSRLEDPPDLVCPTTPRRRTTTPAPAGPVDEIPSATDLQGVIPDTPAGRLVSVDQTLTAKFALSTVAERTGPLRIAVYGDSHVAAGTFSDELARLIRARGLDVETSYFPPTMGRAGVRLPLRKYCVATTWTLQPAYRSGSEVLRTGRSLMNLVSAPKGNNYLWLDFRNSERQSRVVRLRVHYVPNPGETAVGFIANDGTEKIVRLPRGGGEQATPGVVELQVEDTLSTVKLRVLYGTLILQGFEVDYRDPRPVTLDVFGIPSATARGWARTDATFLTESLRRGTYDAVILEYGTNEGSNTRFEREAYATSLRQSLQAFRQIYPDAGCLLLGPTDRGVRVSRSRARRASSRRPVDLLRYARIHHEISELQATIGREYQCAAWDWQAFMGGTGAMYRWALRSPTLAASDLIHLTPGGYRLSANALADALGWSLPHAP